MPSTLTFSSTKDFRDRLLLRNLVPYNVPGSYVPPSGQIVREITIRDEGVYDSPGDLIENPPSNLGPVYHGLYGLNEYGPTGGFADTIQQSLPLVINTNKGEYNIFDASLPLQSRTGIGWPAGSIQSAENNLPSLNKYSFEDILLFSATNLKLVPTFTQYTVNSASLPSQSLLGVNWMNEGVPEVYIPSKNRYGWSDNNGVALYSVDTIDVVPRFEPYAAPLSFIPSQYTPYQILLNTNPTGSDGSLQQDSFIVQLGAKLLKKEFEERIGRETLQNTVGRFNLPNAANDPVMAVQLLQGKIPLIERDWVITRPDNILLRTVDFIGRLGGLYYPGSEIPGDYFGTSPHNLNLAGQIAAATTGNANPQEGLLGKAFGKFLHKPSGSQLFLNNTGGGQKSQLYFTLGFNRYGPNYDKGLVGNIGDGIRAGLNSILDNPTKGGYYVGSKNNEPSYVDGPSGKLPLNIFGQEVQTSVYGPDVLADLYEPGIQSVKFGFAGNSFYGGGGLSGGLIWSTKVSNEKLGFNVGKNGNLIKKDPQYDQTKSYLSLDTSDDKSFREGSLLWHTQQLVNAGEGDTKHVGNAINQVSKVFNDGYKEITKGSKVMSYVTENGVEVGKEYCRVFTKDTPYFTYGDLQKRGGNHRGYSYSVLDSTYNLNIAPLKSSSISSSTNIRDGRVKKYMFSIENLAWRTSHRQGLTYLDLPECERGPNGGRVMWFPPYDLKFTETVTPKFNSQDFIGRPEPVFTYSNTSRSGSLSWMIIVDHPSVLNTIVNKELEGKNKELVNSIVESFFAGCKKYDIYELAKRYNTIPINELYNLQQIITNPSVKYEDVAAIVTDVKPVDNTMGASTQNTNVDLKKYIGLGYYFDNDEPDPKTRNETTTANFKDLYADYVNQTNINTYVANADGTKNKEAVGNFFESVVKYNFTLNSSFLNDLLTFFQANKRSDGGSNGIVQIQLEGSASAPNTKDYNIPLSSRRKSSVKNYLLSWNNGIFAEYINNKSLVIIDGPSFGEEPVGGVNPLTKDVALSFSSCSDNDSNTTPYDKVYSTNAMACRRVVISKIDQKVTGPDVNKIDTTENIQGGSTTTPGYKRPIITPGSVSTQQKLKDGISKKILRSMLTECDYFNLIEENNPVVYDSIKDSIKYFSPAFHSMTPEGLNSRLTFLNQCTRPGDTIPVIDNDGNPKYSNANNTSFGAPPVLVLRIGDFYNTKIIPTSMSIVYDPLILDINPEGIGVQPMLAKITLQFNFVGGSGLKEPIDKLQNALSFNFYGNTEMYDERADATDDSYKKIDEDILKDILAKTQLVNVNNSSSSIVNEGGTTIGVVSNKTDSDLGTSGTTTYKKIMDDGLLPQGQTYMKTMLDKMYQITNEYNFQLYTLFIQNMRYVDGYTRQFTTPNTLKIFGKSDSVETRLNTLFDLINADIDNLNETNYKITSGLDFIRSLYFSNFNKQVIRKVKQNLKNQINSVKSNITTLLTSVDNEITSVQTNLVRTFAKLDVIDTNTDGYIKTDQGVKIYNISGTTEVSPNSTDLNTYDELVTDYNSATNILYSYYNLLKSSGFIEIPYTPENLTTQHIFEGLNNVYTLNAEKRFYAVMSRVILNDNLRNSFINNIITPDIANEKGNNPLNLLEYTTYFYNRTSNIYTIEHNKELDFILFAGPDKVRTNSVYGDTYMKWSPFKVGKTRTFNFTTYVAGTTQQMLRIQNLYKNGNLDNVTTSFNGKNKLN